MIILILFMKTMRMKHSFRYKGPKRKEKQQQNLKDEPQVQSSMTFTVKAFFIISK